LKPPLIRPAICWYVQAGASDTGVSYEIDFSTPVSSVSMEMVGFKGSQSTSGVVVPEWSVTAYDANNSVLGTFSEPLLSSFSDIPPTDFTLHGAIGDPITHVVVSGNAENHAAFAAPLFDRIVTT